MILPVLVTVIILTLIALFVCYAIEYICDIINIRQVNNKPTKLYISFDERLEITKYFKKKLPNFEAGGDVLFHTTSAYHLYFFNKDLAIKVQKYVHYTNKELIDNEGCAFKDYSGFVYSIWKDSENRLMTFREKEFLCEYINSGQLDLLLKQIRVNEKLKEFEDDFKL